MSDFLNVIPYLVGCLVFVLLIRWWLKGTHYSCGYNRVLKNAQRGITKTYHGTEVTFYNWGSDELTADGNDNYLGIYCIINSYKDLEKYGIGQYFDKVDVDHHQSNYMFTLTKKGLFLGSDEMKDFLQKIDNFLNLNC